MSANQDPLELLIGLAIKKIKYVIPVIILIVVAIVGSFGIKIIDTGHRGVKTVFGKVEEQSLPEGLYFYNPLTSNIISLDVRETKMEQTTDAYSKDAQNVKISFVVNYHPDASQMHTLYRTIGFDWAAKIVPQIILGRVKEVIGKYEAVELISKREEAIKEIYSGIEDKLLAKLISLKNFQVTNVDFNDAFENAVEAKVVAIQQAEEAKNKTVKIKEEADQRIISAKAEAESMRIRSQALQQNKGLVDYEAVQKWDGKLPATMLGGSSIPFINLNGKN